MYCDACASEQSVGPRLYIWSAGLTLEIIILCNFAGQETSAERRVSKDDDVVLLAGCNDCKREMLNHQEQNLTRLASLKHTILGFLFIAPQANFDLASHNRKDLAHSPLDYLIHTPLMSHEITDLARSPDCLSPNFRQPDVLEKALLLQSLQGTHHIFEREFRLFHPRGLENIDRVCAAEFGKTVLD